jgi:murein DD-endopeptidase MepM/ murein hydrolase activator NlpD
MQGNSRSDDSGLCTSGCSTHNDDSMRFAFDFDLPEGTQVLAARAGTVVLANGNWSPDHCGGVSAPAVPSGGVPAVGNETNFVEIDHGDGTSALYLHLMQVSPSIERKAAAGARVEQGEVLGLSGKTGFTQCVPHLHFQVETSVRADWFTTSLPVSFSDHDVVVRTVDGVPVEGESYHSENIPIGELR